MSAMLVDDEVSGAAHRRHVDASSPREVATVIAGDGVHR
jgi:hypothetical protein